MKHIPQYNVNVTRDGRWWMIEIPRIDGLTQARRLKEVEKMARDYIALATDQTVGEVELGHVNIVVGEVDISTEQRRIHLLNEAARVAREHATTATSNLINELLDEEVTLRDIATLLGVSYQRIQQIASR